MASASPRARVSTDRDLHALRHALFVSEPPSCSQTLTVTEGPDPLSPSVFCGPQGRLLEGNPRITGFGVSCNEPAPTRGRALDTSGHQESMAQFDAMWSLRPSFQAGQIGCGSAPTTDHFASDDFARSHCVPPPVPPAVATKVAPITSCNVINA